jgi:hypothetical protein
MMEAERVTAVLFADGCHEVAEGGFTVDSYEYVYWAL